MRVLDRLRNTYEYGGIKEIARKSFYKVVYKIHNNITYRQALKAHVEFGLNKEERDTKIVISLTTFPPRFKHIGIVIKSILYQDVKPDKIVIYLDKDTTYADLTEEMKLFEQYGVEYRFHNETWLKAHSKYLFAMQDFPEAIVVTTDDDVILPRNWLRTLLDSYEKYPKAVSARRVHLMTYDENGFNPYNHWKDQWRKEKKPSHLLFATGVGGVLYPPKCLDKEVFNQDRIKEVSLDNDDIWLKCWEVLSGTPVVWAANNEVDLADTEGSKADALSASNVNESRNDTIMKRVLENLNLSTNDFIYKD